MKLDKETTKTTEVSEPGYQFTYRGSSPSSISALSEFIKTLGLDSQIAVSGDPYLIYVSRDANNNFTLEIDLGAYTKYD